MIDRMQNYRIIWYGDTISGKYYQIFCQILTNSSASKNKKEPVRSGTSSSFFSLVKTEQTVTAKTAMLLQI